MIYLSLGPNCHSSGIIKLLNLKKRSYPFDWLISDLDIVIDCLLDNFNKFINKESYYKKDNDLIIYHKCYTKLKFVHKDPTKEIDYLYTLRCIERFNNLQYCNDEMSFLYTTYGSSIDIDKIKILHKLLLEKFVNIKIIICNYIKVNLINDIRHEYIKTNIYTIINIYIVYDTMKKYDIDRRIMNYHTIHNPISSLDN